MGGKTPQRGGGFKGRPLRRSEHGSNSSAHYGQQTSASGASSEISRQPSSRWETTSCRARRGARAKRCYSPFLLWRIGSVGPPHCRHGRAARPLCGARPGSRDGMRDRGQHAGAVRGGLPSELPSRWRRWSRATACSAPRSVLIALALVLLFQVTMSAASAIESHSDHASAADPNSMCIGAPQVKRRPASVPGFPELHQRSLGTRRRSLRVTRGAACGRLAELIRAAYPARLPPG